MSTYAQKSSSSDSVFVHINWVQLTWFLYVEIESIGLNFFLALHMSCRSHSKNFQNNTHSLSHSLPLSVSLTLTLTLTLIPSRSVSHSHSLSLHRRPSLSISFPLLPSRFVAVAPLLHRHRHPNNHCLLAMISILTTAGYHSHLISSMWFLGFISLYEWLFGLSLCFREMGCYCWFCLFIVYFVLFFFFWV